jgi:hypothetical protein
MGGIGSSTTYLGTSESKTGWNFGHATWKEKVKLSGCQLRNHAGGKSLSPAFSVGTASFLQQLLAFLILGQWIGNTMRVGVVPRQRGVSPVVLGPVSHTFIRLEDTRPF